MLLTPTEMERLVIFSAAELARKRRNKGLKLNHPEAVAIISDEVLEGAREGKSVAEMISYGSTILTTDDVLPGVAEMINMIQVEGTFPDGTKLVTIHDPVRAGKQKIAKKDQIIPGEILPLEGDIELNVGRKTVKIKVTNKGDRPIQVGSHYHFFESNKHLDFDRAKSFGMHLDIPAGTAIRFEPGDAKQITLVEFGGSGEMLGLNNLTNGSRYSEEVKSNALRRAKERNFKGA